MSFSVKQALRIMIIKDNKEFGKISRETMRFAVENGKDLNKAINELSREGYFL
jgi:hypothetical protein